MFRIPSLRGLRLAFVGVLLATLLPLAGTAVDPDPALAGPNDNFTLTKTDNVEGEALIGEQITFTLTASGTQVSAAPLYNLSFRDVLPVGVDYVSANPAPTEVLDDVPAAGQTTVIWENVSDLFPSTTSEVTLVVDTNPDFAGGTTGAATVPVGSSFTNSAEAAASLNPFLIPDWDLATGAFTGDFDGTGSDSHSVDVIPFRVTKTGPDELLRGVHQNGFDGASGTTGGLYTIQVENNPDYAVDAVSLLDTLHPGLEFLGCDTYYGADNTTVGEEWTGSGPAATGAGCSPSPTSVDTSGTGQTLVSWDLGNLAPGAVVTVTYQAGIPLFENAPFGASPPSAASLGQGRNLDNNTGPSTGEPDRTTNPDPELLSAPEQELTNTAAATGTYTPTATVGNHSDTTATEAEDLLITKSSAGSLAAGTTVVNTLTISTSEYRDLSNLVVRDLLPSALCFLGTYNSDTTAGGSDWNTTDCPGAGTVQSTINGTPVDAARVRELPDGGPYGLGRFEIVWDFADPDNAALADLDADGTLTIVYSTVVRSHYRGGLAQDLNEPVLAGDEVGNNVEVSGPDTVADAGLTADPLDPDGGVDGDTASAQLTNGFPTIDKRISVKTGPMATGAGTTAATCSASYGTITWSQGSPAAELGYGPGDIVCYELGATFGADVNYEGVTIQDILPAGYEYLTGSATRIASIDTITGTTVTESSSLVTFDVGSGGTVDLSGNAFRWVIAAQLSDNEAGVANDIDANLQKLIHNNNGGQVFQLRDQADAEWTEPEVRLAKGVDTVNSGSSNGPDHDGSLGGGSTAVPVVASDVVTYRIDVWNIGNADALATEVQDVIPTGFDCADVSSISGGGTCTGGRITWTGITVAASTGGGDLTPDDETTAPITLTYDLTIPTDVDPNHTWTNTAGVATYQATSNTGTPYDYYPADNIDPANSGVENTDAADDPAYVVTPAPTMAKVVQSGIDEGGNDRNASPAATADEATIGEIVQYQITATIPAGTTVFDAEVTDTLPAGVSWFTGMGLFGGTVSDLQPTVTSPTGHTALTLGTLSHAAGVVTYELPDPYTNHAGSGDDQVTITFHVQVDDVGTNQADPTTTLANNAALGHDDADGNPQTATTSNTVDVEVVEPNPAVVKDHTVPAGSEAAPGAAITYRVTVTNPTSAANVSVAHDLTVVDTVPVGITPLGAGAVPVSADGDPVPSTGIAPSGAFSGTWSETNRTITWTPTDQAALEAIDPGDTVRFTYDAEVDDPAVASGSLVNTVDITASNLDQDLSPTEDPNDDDGRAYTDDDDDTITVPSATVTKDIEPFNPGNPADDRSTLTIGEPVDYEVTVGIPSGTTAYDATVFDDLPSRLDFDSFGSVTVGTECEVFDAAGGVSTGTPLASGDIETFNPVSGDAQLAAWFLGDVYANGACEITARYTVHVNTIAADTDSITNDAELVWNGTSQVTQAPGALPAGYDDPDSPSWDITAGPSAETVTVVEPQLAIDKDVTTTGGAPLANPTCDTTAGNHTGLSDDADGAAPNGCDTSAGAQLRYTVTVSSVGTSAAHDVTVIDTVPAGLTPLASPGGARVSANGQTVTGNGGRVGTWSETDHTITWTLTGPLAPAGATTLDYDVEVDPSDELSRGQDLTNTVTVDTYHGFSTADRAQIVLDNAANDDLVVYGNGTGATRGSVAADPVTVEVHFPTLDVVKTADAGQDVTDVRLDTPFAWTITVTNTDPVAPAYDVDVVDTLPEGWIYDTGSAQVTTPHNGGPVQVEPTCAATPAGSCNTAADLNTETLTWTDLVAGLAQPLAPGQTITIELTATPASAALTSTQAIGEAYTGYDGGAGFTHTNDVVVTGEDATGSTTCCDPDGPGGTPAPAYTDSDDDEVHIARVDLEVDKAITSPVEVDTDPANGPYWYGSFVNYTVTVTNNGPDTATGVTVADILDPAELGYDGTVAIDQGSWDGPSNTWTVGTMASGTSLDITLRTRLLDLGTLTNVAQVETVDQYDSDSTPSNDEATEDDQDTVSLVAVPSSLGDYVWFDLNGDGVQDPTEPGIPGVQVDLTWNDPLSGLPQYYSTVTSSAGSYGIPVGVGLPTNELITVTINTGGSPNLAGMAPTWDRDLSADGSATEQITGADTTLPSGGLADLDFDFGYNSVTTQSLGDKVWWDADHSADATDGAGEPGLSGVDVTATWAGWDGVLGTADDVDFSTTTDATGNFLFPNLPVGDYRVVVDHTDLPAGLDTQTFDLDGTGTAHQVELTLDPGENQLDVDFSYAGAGSLGDTVWFDHNGDGTIDASEQGISGVTVTATWDGPDGIAGNADDETLTTTTDASGNYSFEHLPWGDWEVTVDHTTLPSGVTQTHDDDGVGTAHTSTTTLSAGSPVDLDHDFGYQGPGSIGDTLWLDRDTSGTPLVDAGDVPLAGVDVIITWDNPNPGGVDLVITATTAADGTYRVDGLPLGDYTVQVDTSTLPAGVMPTYDDDGVGTAHTSTTTLSGGTPVDLDQDFSYAGTGSLGDTVWEDLDGDGVIDPGEPLLGGVPVTIVYTDPISGTTFTETVNTATDGTYRFDDLPAGSYDVTVDRSALPPDFAPTYDLDGVGSPDRVIVTLGAGEDELDVDFGYRVSADLSIDKGHVGDFALGEDNRWTMTITNHGPAEAAAPVEVTDTLPDGVTVVATVAADWQCGQVGQTLTCTYVGLGGTTPIALAAGTTTPIELTVTVEAGVAPEVINTATVSSPTADNDPGNNADTDTTAVPLSILTLTKTLADQELSPGDDATYEIVVTNHGPSPTRGRVDIVDQLPDGLALRSATGEPGGASCTATGNTVTCSTTTSLAVGETITVAVVAEVTASSGEVVNLAQVSGGNEVNGSPLSGPTLETIYDALGDPDGELADNLGISVASPQISDTAPATISPDDDLAFTGASTLLVLAVGLSLAAAGGITILVARLRPRPRPQT